MPRLTDSRLAALIGLAACLVYNSNFRLLGSGDTLPAQYIPLEILKAHTVDLDRVDPLVSRNREQPYWIWKSPNGHFVSRYPIVTPVMAAPLYLPAFLFLEWRGWALWRANEVRVVMEKLSASVIAAGAVALMYLLLRRRLPRSPAVVLTAVFAFATPTWTISSQALWQHGPAELLVLIALLALVRNPGWAAATVAGAACGLIAVNRPPDAILAAGILVALALRSRRHALIAVGAGLAAAFPFLLYHLRAFGTPIGAYAIPGRPSGQVISYFRSPRAIGVAGLLVSPGKGLLVFCPFFAFLALRLRRRALPRDPFGRIDACLAAAVGLQVFVYAGYNWIGGYSYGPRFLADAVPILTFLLAPVLPRLSRRTIAVFGAAALFAAAVQFVGAFYYGTAGSDVCINGPSRISIYGGNAWSLKCTPFVRAARWGRFDPALYRMLAHAVRSHLGGR